jgi:FkbM family methyltransferase
MEPPIIRQMFPSSVAMIRRLGGTFRGTIQVGANKGQEIASYKAHGLEWAIMVEPLDEPFAELKQRLAGEEKYLAVQALCAGRPGIELDFYVASNEGQSSSILRPQRHLKEHPGVLFQHSVKMTTTTVDILLDELAKQIPAFELDCIDILCMDVQGAELEVLKGATALLQRAKYVFCELSYSGLYENDVPLEVLQDFLRGFGFRLNWIDINRHGWGDGLFIRR